MVEHVVAICRIGPPAPSGLSQRGSPRFGARPSSAGQLCRQSCPGERLHLGSRLTVAGRVRIDRAARGRPGATDTRSAPKGRFLAVTWGFRLVGAILYAFGTCRGAEPILSIFYGSDDRGDALMNRSVDTYLMGPGRWWRMVGAAGTAVVVGAGVLAAPVLPAAAAPSGR
jgi:hypothetical protein